MCTRTSFVVPQPLPSWCPLEWWFRDTASNIAGTSTFTDRRPRKVFLSPDRKLSFFVTLGVSIRKTGGAFAADEVFSLSTGRSVTDGREFCCSRARTSGEGTGRGAVQL